MINPEIRVKLLSPKEASVLSRVPVNRAAYDFGMDITLKLQEACMTIVVSVQIDSLLQYTVYSI